MSRHIPLTWQTGVELAEALGDTPVERRWAAESGALTPSFDEVPGFPRLAQIIDGEVFVEGDLVAVAR